ncbi:MAG: hypothetical protein AVO34_00665 [Firmicutes bacterium ML8_F2]|jgi:hypothetical protein|nr:MAG: hypothetical protein AVO34_00665 [Firmicutes bacterium ML8_F2]
MITLKTTWQQRYNLSLHEREKLLDLIMFNERILTVGHGQACAGAVVVKAVSGSALYNQLKGG